jgi:hypothetical protein
MSWGIENGSVVIQVAKQEKKESYAPNCQLTSHPFNSIPENQLKQPKYARITE